MCLILANLSKKQIDLTSSEKHILLVLCLHADKNTNLCWPSIKSLSDDTGISRSQVFRCVNQLKIKNKIRDSGLKKGKTKNVIVYEIIFYKGSHGETAKGCHGDTVKLLKQCHTETKGCHHDTVKGCHGDTWKDHVFKDNKKDVFSQEELQQKAWYKKNPGAKVLEKDKYLFDERKCF